MVARNLRDRAREFVLDRLAQSGRYRLLNVELEHGLAGILAEDREVEQNPNFHVVLLDKAVSERDYDHMRARLEHQGSRVAPVFYKDGKTFFRPYTQGKIWRIEPRFKRYNTEQIKQFVRATKLERANSRNGRLLTYFQPREIGEQEKLQFVSMKPVTLDYTHIPPTSAFFEVTPAKQDSFRLMLPEIKESVYSNPAVILEESMNKARITSPARELALQR